MSKNATWDAHTALGTLYECSKKVNKVWRGANESTNVDDREKYLIEYRRNLSNLKDCFSANEEKLLDWLDNERLLKFIIDLSAIDPEIIDKVAVFCGDSLWSK